MGIHLQDFVQIVKSHDSCLLSCFSYSHRHAEKVYLQSKAKGYIPFTKINHVLSFRKFTALI